MSRMTSVVLIVYFAYRVFIIYMIFIICMNCMIFMKQYIGTEQTPETRPRVKRWPKRRVAPWKACLRRI